MIQQQKTRAALYVRVSTNEQAEEGYSLKAQREIGETFCSNKGYEIPTVYVDEGITGTSMKNRFGLDNLLADISEGLIDIVVVWKVSRIARKQLDLLNIIKHFDSFDVKFQSITEAFDTSTHYGKLMLHLLSSFAEFERDSTVENLRMGMNRRAREGFKNGGRMLGYISEGKGKTSRIKIKDDEAFIVKIIFELYVNGKGYKAIANQINKRGFKTVKGNMFSINGIKDILENPTYIGKIKYNRFTDYSTKRRKGKNEDFILVEGKHNAIIDNTIWNKARSIQAEKTRRNTANKGKYPLTGILKCPMCGAGMVSATNVGKLKDGTKRTIRYYVCGQFHNKGSAACKSNSIRADYADSYVIDKVEEFLRNLDVVDDVINGLEDSKRTLLEPIEKLLEHKKNEHKNLQSKLDKSFELYEEGEIEKSDFLSRMGKYKDKKIMLLDEIRVSENEIRKLNVPMGDRKYVKQLLCDVSKLLKKSNPIERKALIRLIIEKIIVSKKEIESIHFKVTNATAGIIGGELSDDGSPYFIFEHKLNLVKECNS